MIPFNCIYLKNCREPYSKKYLYEIKDSLRIAYIDMDADGTKEMVIDCGDTLVLRYLYGDRIVAYSYTYPKMYSIKTDGSYEWNNTSTYNFQYGEARLQISDDGNYERVILWRVVNDGKPDASYFIGEERVTQEQLVKYLTTRTVENAEFSAFDTASFEPDAVTS